MNFDDQIKLIKQSKQVHGKWYKEKYPDVKIIAMDPAVHYLKYGAKLGRNPGKFFDTNFYLEKYPDVKESGLNPLVHYVKFGKKEGRERKPKTKDQIYKLAAKDVSLLKRKLYTLGFTEQALGEIKEIADSDVASMRTAYACKEMAYWYICEGSEDAHKKCLEYIEKAKSVALAKSLATNLAVIEILCLFGLEKYKEINDVYENSYKGNYWNPDISLVYSNAFSNEVDKMEEINVALRHYEISPIKLISDNKSMPYDRLSVVNASEKIYNEDVKITVLIAAFNSESTIVTTLRCLQEQSWQNLEILVIDDASTDQTCAVVEEYAKSDSRIKLLRQEKNAGAYVARNRGLDEAEGIFITIHDADDWSHPDKIAIQAKYLLENESAIGCTSQQARISTLLNFTRITGAGQFIINNISSFMYKRSPIKENLGYWDTVRFSADSELIRRIQKTFGNESVCHLKTGPLSFQRDSDTSIVADEHFGIQGSIYGIRQEYLEAQTYFHNSAGNLKYTGKGSTRAFPVPQTMVHAKSPDETEREHFDVIIVSEFRMVGGSVKSNIEEIKTQKQAGLKTGIIQLYRYDLGAKSKLVMLPEVRAEIDGSSVQVITFGQKVSCDLLLFRYPPILEHKQKFFPDVLASEVKVIINQPPMSDYTPEGKIRYSINSCVKNIRAYTGKDATWYPIGPLVRETLEKRHQEELQHITLSEKDWSNIIDIEGWYRGPGKRTGPKKLRIGRHSRDIAAKWPATSSEILAAYPSCNNVEVHILGGVSAVQGMLGVIPKNWTIYEFGSLAPKDFLAEIDIFVYFSHPDWIESFGRTIIEAMAVGIPVILPEKYRPLFNDAAIYTSPEKALDIAISLYNDDAAYQRQVNRALLMFGINLAMSYT